MKHWSCCELLIIKLLPPIKYLRLRQPFRHYSMAQCAQRCHYLCIALRLTTTTQKWLPSSIWCWKPPWSVPLHCLMLITTTECHFASHISVSRTICLFSKSQSLDLCRLHGYRLFLRNSTTLSSLLFTWILLEVIWMHIVQSIEFVYDFTSLICTLMWSACATHARVALCLTHLNVSLRHWFITSLFRHHLWLYTLTLIRPEITIAL